MKWSPHEAASGLHRALDVLTDAEGNTLPQMAEALGCSFARLDGVVADMRWLQEALERAERRVGASDA